MPLANETLGCTNQSQMPETAGCWFVRKPKQCKAFLEQVDLVTRTAILGVTDRVTEIEKCVETPIKGSLITFSILPILVTLAEAFAPHTNDGPFVALIGCGFLTAMFLSL